MVANVLTNFIGGEWTAPNGGMLTEVRNPATGTVLATVAHATAAEVDRAARAAAAAQVSWREVPPVVRARFLFKFRDLLEKHADELTRICTAEHGKTFAEAKSDLGRGIENVEHACGIPALLMGGALENVAQGIDCETLRQPVGVFAAITPFNFPPMVPLWFLPYAIACGNTFILKPSEQVPLTQRRVFELLQETGLPAGVANLVNGSKEVVDAFCTHPAIDGVSFVGSTTVARHVYETASRHGKRVQALGGAKNHLVVLPDADMPRALQNVCDSIYGCAGQRCLAGSIVVGVGSAYDAVRDGLLAAARAIKVGDGADPATTMGPVISARHLERVLGYIEKGQAEGAKLLLDGRGVKVAERPGGFWIGPTVFEGVEPEMTIAREEIFGPVVCLMRAATLDDAIQRINAGEYANAASLYTSSGKAAREFRHRAAPGMIGINIGVAAPMAMFPFGGAKSSLFGPLKAHGSQAIDFYTASKVSISRWF